MSRIILRLEEFLCVRDAGSRGNKITVVQLNQRFEELQGYGSISIDSAFSCDDGDVFKNIQIRLDGT